MHVQSHCCIIILLCLITFLRNFCLVVMLFSYFLLYLFIYYANE